MRHLILLPCLLLGLMGCAVETAPITVRKAPLVATVNYPLAYFAERLAGEHITLHFPVPADEDPDFWKPTPEQIGEFQAAELILLNGAGYAKWTESASLPLTKCVDTSVRFAKRYLQQEKSITHSHGPTGEHSHTGFVGYTWLDPMQAIEQAEEVRNGLCRLLPEHTKSIQQRFETLKQELVDLDQQLQTITQESKPRPWIGSHPVFGYLARRYQLSIQNVHLEAGEMPSSEQLQELQMILKKHPAKNILWESEPLPAIVTKLQELGLKSVTFDTLGNRPEHGDYLALMKQNLANLKQVYQP